MHVLRIVMLSLAIVGAPAAQASLCRCAEAPLEESAGCPCSPSGECCGCCLPESEEGGGTKLDDRCPCGKVAPKTSHHPVLVLPAAAPGTVFAAEAVSPSSAAVIPAVERRDPHPEVCLPLLI